MASVGSPPSISRAGASAWTTALSQARQPYLGRRVTITRNCAGITSSRSATSSPIRCIAPWQHGQVVLVRLDHHLFPRQVLGQRPAIDTALLPARRLPRRVGLLRLGLALGDRLFEVLEGELQLIGMGRLLGAPAEQGPLQLFDDRPQLLVVPGQLGRRRPFGQQQSFERRHVIGQRGGFGGIRRRAHGGSGSHRRRLVIH